MQCPSISLKTVKGLNSVKSAKINVKIIELEADVLVPEHSDICDRDYIPEMSAFIQVWIDAVTEAIDKGMSLEEAQDKESLLDRYPMQPRSEPIGRQ